MTPSPALDAPPFEALAQQSTVFLDDIMHATTREALAEAQARGWTFLQGLVAQGEIGARDASLLRALQDMAADERLRDLSAPGAPPPVGLFGGQL